MVFGGNCVEKQELAQIMLKITFDSDFRVPLTVPWPGNWHIIELVYNLSFRTLEPTLFSGNYCFSGKAMLALPASLAWARRHTHDFLEFDWILKNENQHKQQL